MKRRSLAGLGLVLALGVAAPAWADAVDTLRDFVREVKSGRASFTQTVTSADGARKKSSSGQFEFLRPNRFRFSYAKPFEQLIVADGTLVWIHDTDLNQVSSRPVAQALGATPAALLTGGDIDRDFVLSALPSAEGLVWVQATPRAKDGPFQSLKLGFRGRDLAAVDIVDAFGQRSLLQFTRFEANVSLQPEAFRFTPPPGADVIRQ
jgi:outer membrane lipoprotein carrier protein